MFSGYRHLKIDHRYKFTNGKVSINGEEGFCSFAKERLIKHHGNFEGEIPFVSQKNGMEYHHKIREEFDLLVQILLGAPN